jgi:hypothetical protein
MKKLLLLCTAILAFGSASEAQVIKDTLRYFQWKQWYILPAWTTTTVNPIFKSNAAVTTNTAFTHVGSIFKNKTKVEIRGLEARCRRPAVSVTLVGQGGPPLRLYLCNVDANGLPILPAIDSVQAGVLDNTAFQYGQKVGGNLTTVRTVTTDFAVLIRNVSGKDGDTVFVLRTSGHTTTSTAAPTPWHKFGDGYGVVRNGGTFFKTINYNHPLFGIGTDYEFMVSPIVQYTLETSQIESPTQSGACCWQVFTNTNTSTPAWGSRQFNFNEFYRYWQSPVIPFQGFSTMNPPVNFTPDSIFTWVLGDGSPPYYSPSGVDSVHLAFVANKCNQFYNGNFTAKHQLMANRNSQTYSTSFTFTASTVWCGGDTASTGLLELGDLSSLKVYPNPTADKTTISGLKGRNSIYVYDMLGQLVSTQVTDKEVYVVDLLKQPHGNYMIRISSSDNKTRVVKILKE